MQEKDLNINRKYDEYIKRKIKQLLKKQCLKQLEDNSAEKKTYINILH